LISDANGDASLSRFQFLVFTFVVAMSLFYLIVIKTPPDYPAIPNQILALLGISGGSYVLSKGIQTGSATDTADDETETKAPAKSANKKEEVGAKQRTNRRNDGRAVTSFLAAGGQRSQTKFPIDPQGGTFFRLTIFPRRLGMSPNKQQKGQLRDQTTNQRAKAPPYLRALR